MPQNVTSDPNVVCIPADKTTTQTKQTSTTVKSNSGGAGSTSQSSTNTSTKVAQKSTSGQPAKSSSVTRSTSSSLSSIKSSVQNFFNKLIHYDYLHQLRSMLSPGKLGGYITVSMMAAVGAGAIGLLLCYFCVKRGWCEKLRYHMINCYNKMKSKFNSFRKCVMDQSTSESIRPV